MCERLDPGWSRTRWVTSLTSPPGKRFGRGPGPARAVAAIPQYGDGLRECRRVCGNGWRRERPGLADTDRLVSKRSMPTTAGRRRPATHLGTPAVIPSPRSSAASRRFLVAGALIACFLPRTPAGAQTPLPDLEVVER